MLASLGCFFAQLSYSLRTARLDSSLFMLATQTLPHACHRWALRDFAKHKHAELAMLGWAKPLFSWVVQERYLGPLKRRLYAYKCLRFARSH